jgi:hypothetical protein
MTTTPSPELKAPGESRTVQLYGVSFDYKVEGAESGGNVALLEVEIPSDALAERYGIDIQDDWVEELERTYGVKL